MCMIYLTPFLCTKQRRTFTYITHIKIGYRGTKYEKRKKGTYSSNLFVLDFYDIIAYVSFRGDMLDTVEQNSKIFGEKDLPLLFCTKKNCFLNFSTEISSNVSLLY